MNQPLTRSRPGQPDAGRRSVGPRRRERRAILVGLAVSFLLHLLVIGLSRFVGGGEDRPMARTGPEPVLHGMRVQEIRAVDAETTPVAESPEPEPPPAPSQDPRPVAPPADASPVAAEDAAVPSLRDRLMPGTGDPRLWAPLEPRQPTPEELMREGAYARIQGMNDSIAAEMEAARRALDWTIKTEDGRRWGISPEGIHLGGLTLPAPTFGPPPGRRDEVQGRLDEWNAIHNQRLREEGRSIFEDRVRAIRERRDQERRPPPDTTGSRN